MDGSELDAVDKFMAHEGVTEDVRWHCFHDKIFGSVGDDMLLKTWDLRERNVEGKLATPTASVKAGDKEVNSLAFSPFSEFLLLTASSDKCVKLWIFAT